MTDYIDEQKIKEEVLVFLRNSDIIPVATRGVATTTQTASLSLASGHTISTAQVRNIRSLSVGGTDKSFGTDYTVSYGTSSTAPTLVSFATTETGTLSVTFDHGSADKIYSDFPRPDLSLSSFPRIGFDIFTIDSNAGGFGNVNRSDIRISIVVYDDSGKDVTNYISTIRKKIIDAQTSFYYLKVVKPKSQGPLLKSPLEKGKNKIMQKNIDVMSILNYEKN